MARILPARLADKSGQGRRFDVEVVSEPFTAGTEDLPTLMRRIMDRGSAGELGHRRGPHRPSAALTRAQARCGSESRTRLGAAVSSSAGGLAAADESHGGPWKKPCSACWVRRPHRAEGPPRSQPLLGPFAGRLTPIHPGPVGEEETADLRYVVSGPRGYLRVLFGMVRANRPWRLVPGLSKALAAALATGAIATVNSTVWSLAGSLSAPRLVIAMVGSRRAHDRLADRGRELWHRTDRALAGGEAEGELSTTPRRS